MGQSKAKSKARRLKVAMRVNASSTLQQIATGHLLRCQNLAQELIRRGHKVCLWVNDDPIVPQLLHRAIPTKKVSDFKKVMPFDLKRSNIDVLIIDLPDEPATEASDPSLLFELSSKGITLVKLGHTGYISGYYSAVISLYPTGTLWTANYYEGPAYLILDRKFKELKSRKVAGGKVKEVFVSMGGTDLMGFTSLALRALARARYQGHVSVILGPGNPHAERVAKTITECSLNAAVLTDVKNIEQQMLKADMAVAAFGTTVYELISLGIPAVTVSHYPWQAQSAHQFAQLNAMIFAGVGSEVSESALAKEIGRLLGDGALRKAFSEQGPKLIDHKGVNRVADAVENCAKPKEELDCLYILAHPGDEIFACGGTILKQVAAGKAVGLALLSDGYMARRREEFGPSWESEQQRTVTESLQNSIKALGVKPAYYYKLPDNQFDKLPLLEIVKIAEHLISVHKPKSVYTNSPNDLNIDHQLTFRAVVTAARPKAGSPVEKIFTVETPSSSDWAMVSGLGGFEPNWFEDIAAYMKEKRRVAAFYSSELCKDPHPRSLKGLEEKGRFWGRVAGLAAAEAFQLIRCKVKE